LPFVIAENSDSDLMSGHMRQVNSLYWEVKGKQKGQKEQKMQKSRSFAIFVLFAFFVSTASFAMEHDFKNVPRPQDSDNDK
jgi:hypothetical protein